MHVINKMRVVGEICFAGDVKNDCTNRVGDLRSRPDPLFAFEGMRAMQERPYYQRNFIEIKVTFFAVLLHGGVMINVSWKEEPNDAGAAGN